MREPSLRPERSASANSATSAFFVRTEFYLKDWFCQPEVSLGEGFLKVGLFSCFLNYRTRYTSLAPSGGARDGMKKAKFKEFSPALRFGQAKHAGASVGTWRASAVWRLCLDTNLRKP